MRCAGLCHRYNMGTTDLVASATALVNSESMTDIKDIKATLALVQAELATLVKNSGRRLMERLFGSV